MRSRRGVRIETRRVAVALAAAVCWVCRAAAAQWTVARVGCDFELSVVDDAEVLFTIGIFDPATGVMNVRPVPPSSVRMLPVVMSVPLLLEWIS